MRARLQGQWPTSPRLLLVDVEDHDALGSTPRGMARLQPRVVQDVVQLRQKRQPAVGGRVLLSRVDEEQQHDREAQRDPCQVLSQGFRP